MMRSPRELCSCAVMQLCSYAVVQLCSYAVVQLCSYAVMQFCSYAVVQLDLITSIFLRYDQKFYLYQKKTL